MEITLLGDRIMEIFYRGSRNDKGYPHGLCRRSLKFLKAIKGVFKYSGERQLDKGKNELTCPCGRIEPL